MGVSCHISDPAYLLLSHTCASVCHGTLQILRIRVTHEELLSLLKPEEVTQLRVGDAFRPFAIVNVRFSVGVHCSVLL